MFAALKQAYYGSDSLPAAHGRNWLLLAGVAVASNALEETVIGCATKQCKDKLHGPEDTAGKIRR